MILNSLFKHWSYKLLTPGTILREKYTALKNLLGHDINCHEMMADLQDLLHSGRNEDFTAIRHRFSLFSEQVAGMIECLENMDPGRYSALKDYQKKFDFYTRYLLAPPAINASPPFVQFFNEITPADKQLGNKAKNLALLENNLGILVPRGFAIPSSAYHFVIEHNQLRQLIDEKLQAVVIESETSLQQASLLLTQLILNAEIPPPLEQAIDNAVKSWEGTDDKLRLAVRSSAINEDGACSFAGQYATVLDVKVEGIFSAYLRVLASKYSEQALFYRINSGFGDEDTAMSVLVQEMVPAKCSGVLYTTDISDTSQGSDHLQLHVIPGLGEKLVGGTIIPDHYELDKANLTSIQNRKGKESLLTEQQVASLANLGLTLEKYFGSPQDIEWAIDNSDNIFILQARPLPRSTPSVDICSEIEDALIIVDECVQASWGIASGPVFLLENAGDIEKVPEGAVVVSRDAPPEYVRLLNRVSAILSERGSRASHFATVAREFGLPFLCSVDGATQIFSSGDIVTVDGNQGKIYRGKVHALLSQQPKSKRESPYKRILTEAMKFISPLELTDPAAANFTPEGCRSMHDIIRFCHEKAMLSMFSAGKPGTGRGSIRLEANIPLDVYLFDVGGGLASKNTKLTAVPLAKVKSTPFQALWLGLSHPHVQWKQKPFDWDAYDKIELAGGVPPQKDSFAFASYAVVGNDYLHFNIRFGYHFTIVDVLCGENRTENHCLLRFAGGGGDYEHRSLRIDFLYGVLERLEFQVEKKGDLLEARIQGLASEELTIKLDLLGRLLGATKLMDMVLENDEMVKQSVEDFFNGRYSFSQEG